MRPSALLLAFLLVPGAAAAAIEVDLVVDDGDLRGDVEIGGALGAFELAGVPGLEAASIRFSSAQGYLVTRSYGFVGPGRDLVEVGTEERGPQNDTLRFDAGSLHDLRCGTDCRILLYADGEGQLSARGRSSGPPERLGEPTVYATGSRTPGHPDSFVYEAAAGWFRVGAAGEGGPFAPTDVRARGTLRLYLANASVEVAGPRPATLSAMTSREPEPSPIGVSHGTIMKVRFLLLELREADLALTGTAPLLLPFPQVALTGALDAVRARGSVVVDGHRREVADEAAFFEGSFALRLAAGAPALAPVAPAAWRATGEGEGTVRVGGVAFEPARTAISPTAALVAGAGGLVLLVLLGKLVATFLYTRLDRATLLENPNRRRVFEHIARAPGVSIQTLVRETGLLEVVVRHHLDALRRHGFVTLAASGRLRQYFPVGRPLDALTPELTLALADRTRRRVAEALLERAGSSQNELAGHLGLSQRLVSHHLLRLSREGLLVVEGSMPRRYSLSPAAVRALRAWSPAPPGSPGEAASG